MLTILAPLTIFTFYPYMNKLISNFLAKYGSSNNDIYNLRTNNNFRYHNKTHKLDAFLNVSKIQTDRKTQKG